MNSTLKLQENRDRILALAREHGATNVRVFGSVARGEASDRSDVDLLVEFGPEVSLLDHATLLNDLEDLLEIRVDVINDKALRRELREVVEREAVAL